MGREKVRDWRLAQLKREREGNRCRVCRYPRQIEMAHIWRREADQTDPLGTRTEKPWMVYPERVVPLCKDHHEAYDTRRLDLLPHLTVNEQAQAVIDARGLENARMRLCPSAYERFAA